MQLGLLRRCGEQNSGQPLLMRCWCSGQRLESHAQGEQIELKGGQAWWHRRHKDTATSPAEPGILRPGLQSLRYRRADLISATNFWKSDNATMFHAISQILPKGNCHLVFTLILPLSKVFHLHSARHSFTPFLFWMKHVTFFFHLLPYLNWKIPLHILLYSALTLALYSGIMPGRAWGTMWGSGNKTGTSLC